MRRFGGTRSFREAWSPTHRRSSMDHQSCDWPPSPTWTDVVSERRSLFRMSAPVGTRSGRSSSKGAATACRPRSTSPFGEFIHSNNSFRPFRFLRRASPYLGGPSGVADLSRCDRDVLQARPHVGGRDHRPDDDGDDGDNPQQDQSGLPRSDEGVEVPAWHFATPPGLPRLR